MNKQRKAVPSDRKAVTIVNASNFALSESHVEKVTKGESLTQPNQALTTREILEKYRRTGQVHVGGRPIVSGDTDDEDFDAVDLEKVSDQDLVDQQALIAENKRVYERMARARKEAQDKADAEAREKASGKAAPSATPKGPLENEDVRTNAKGQGGAKAQAEP